MRRHFPVKVDLFVAVLFLASTGLPMMGLADSPGPERVLLERDAEFDRVTAEKGLEGFLSFLADDAAFFPADGHISEGADGARAIWSGILTTPGVSLRWKPVKAELARSGELGYTYGTYILRQKEPGGQVTESFGKYVTIWRKGPDGAWKVAADIGTPSPPPDAESSE